MCSKYYNGLKKGRYLLLFRHIKRLFNMNDAQNKLIPIEVPHYYDFALISIIRNYECDKEIYALTLSLMRYTIQSGFICARSQLSIRGVRENVLTKMKNRKKKEKSFVASKF